MNSTRYSTVVVVKLYSGTRYFKKRKCLGFRNDVLRNEALGKNNKLAKMNNKFCEDLNDYIKNCVRRTSYILRRFNTAFEQHFSAQFNNTCKHKSDQFNNTFGHRFDRVHISVLLSRS